MSLLEVRNIGPVLSTLPPIEIETSDNEFDVYPFVKNQFWVVGFDSIHYVLFLAQGKLANSTTTIVTADVNSFR
jgi:hypothetical protein